MGSGPLMTQTKRYTATLVRRIEQFIQRFVTLADEAYSLPLALWVINTYLWESFTAVPYLCITAATKRSGKTLLSEVLAFMCNRSKQAASMTAAAMYRIIENEKPTLFLDETEALLSSEAQTKLSQVLNSGYRKGQVVSISVGEGYREFSVFGPKVFIQIGDVRGTLQDRSIVIRMRRAEPKEEFDYDRVHAEGSAIAARVAEKALDLRDVIYEASANFSTKKELGFLGDRDKEIWKPLFVIATLVCPERLRELKRIAVDMATEKTQDRRDYKKLQDAEAAAQEDDFAVRLIRDLSTVFNGTHPNLSSEEAVVRLRDLEVGPWRKYRGEGLDVIMLAQMLSRFGLAPCNVRIGRGRNPENRILKGYKKADVIRGLKNHNL